MDWVQIIVTIVVTVVASNGFWTWLQSTQDEFENLYKYLYKPYKDCGGNGSAERIMEQVKKLPYAHTNQPN